MVHEDHEKASESREMLPGLPQEQFKPVLFNKWIADGWCRFVVSEKYHYMVGDRYNRSPVAE
jgi:hypothetical protein